MTKLIFFLYIVTSELKTKQMTIIPLAQLLEFPSDYVNKGVYSGYNFNR